MVLFMFHGLSVSHSLAATHGWAGLVLDLLAWANCSSRCLSVLLLCQINCVQIASGRAVLGGRRAGTYSWALAAAAVDVLM